MDNSETQPPASERRKLQRLPSRDSFVTSTAGEFELLNLCPNGLAIRGPGVNDIKVGQQHLFVVTDRGQTFEVAGEVRWTTHEAEGGGSEKAGIAFVDVLSAEPHGLWAGVCRHHSPD